jgi:GTPase SAR1 family protein
MMWFPLAHSSLFVVSCTAKPQVLLVGQYSVGKTSFIRYLLGRDFPGQRIGPEPTTDRFTGECHVMRDSFFSLLAPRVLDTKDLQIRFQVFASAKKSCAQQ